MAGSESPQRKNILVKAQPQLQWTLILEMPGPWDFSANANDRCGVGPSKPMRQTACAVGGRAEQVQLPKPFEVETITGEIQMPDTELQV